MVSLDTELAWGTVHRRSYAGYERAYGRARLVIDDLLSLFERYAVGGTWAVVGHLFLDRCRPEGGVKHPEIVRPDYTWFTGDWFDRDPCTDVSRDPFWYGPDIVERIQTCDVEQEIAAHNFSHMVVGDPGFSRESFRSELHAARAMALRHGVNLKSFVFPRNAIAHLDVLASEGFSAFRGVASGWIPGLPALLQKPARVADEFLPVGAPVTRPVRQAGLWNIPASYQYARRNGWDRLVPVWARVRKAVLSLRKAADEGGLFHLSTHPINIAADPEPMLDGLETILQEAKSLRDSGLIVSHTMGSLAQTLETEAEVRADAIHPGSAGSGQGTDGSPE